MNKKLKSALMCLLLIGSFGVTTACKNDTTEENNSEIYKVYLKAVDAGATELSYEQWLAQIKGEKGADAIAPKVRINEATNCWEVSIDNGTTWTSTGIKATGEKGNSGKDAIAPQVRINGTSNYWEISTDNGATWTSTNVKATGEKGDASKWLSDEGKPTQNLGNIDDFYLDTLNKDIYKKTSEGWELQLSIDEKEKEIEITEGLYVVVEEEDDDVDNYIEIRINENKEIESVIAKATLVVPPGSKLSSGAKVTSYDEETNTIEIDVYGESSATPITLDEGTYNINQTITMSGESITILGTLNEKLEAVDLSLFVAYDLSEDASYEIVEGLMKTYIADGIYYFDVKDEEYTYLNQPATKLEYVNHIEEQYKGIVYGTYTNQDEGSVVTISEDKVSFFYQYYDMSAITDYEIEWYDIRSNMDIIVDTETATYTINLDFYTRQCIFTNIEYKYAGVYGEDDETFVIRKNDAGDGYEISSDRVTFEEVNSEYEFQYDPYGKMLYISDSYSVIINPITRTFEKLTVDEVPLLGTVYKSLKNTNEYYYINHGRPEKYNAKNKYAGYLGDYYVEIDFVSECVSVGLSSNHFYNLSFTGWNTENKTVFENTFGDGYKASVTIDATTHVITSIQITNTNTNA